MRPFAQLAAIVLGLSGAACESGQGGTAPPTDAATSEDSGSPAADAEPEPGDGTTADIAEVRVTGDADAYTFIVSVSSPDTGCDQYADWWEVTTKDGTLVYRRILTHSHVNEQPFTRRGGPVELGETTEAIVRAHMNDAGYGGVAFSGSPASGFTVDPSVTTTFAPELADATPQPDGCAF